MNQPERRTHNLELVDAVTCAVRGELANHCIISEETHREHHAFIAEYIAEVKRKRERSEKIKAHVGGWAIVAVLSGIGTGAWKGFWYVVEHLK